MGRATQGKESVGPKTAPASIPPPALSPRLAHPLMVLVLLSLLATAIYSNTFSASFHFDDAPHIVDNPKIKHLAILLDFSGSRYVGFLTFALNYHFGQLNVFGYHLVNLLIHTANGFLVFLLVQLLFRVSSTPPLTPYALSQTTAPWIALSTALLFVAHPVQTEAVTYIVQRFAALAASFYLLTGVGYLQWRLSSPETKSRYVWYIGALITTLLAMKTKETTFTLPFMLLLIEAVFFGPLTRKSWIGLIPFFLTLPIIPLSRPGALGEGEAGFARETMDIGRFDYLYTQFRVLLTYLRLLIFPVHQNLDYDYPVYHSVFDPPVLVSFLFLSALFALAIYLLLASRHTSYAPRPLPPGAARLVAFGILWFFLTLSIESSIIPIHDVIFEHRLYLPSVGFWLALNSALFGLSDRAVPWKVIGLGVLIVVFSTATYLRNQVWKDDFTLWSDVISNSPKKARGHHNLGLAFSDQERLDEAMQEYKTALALKPDYAYTHNNLGSIYKKLGRLDEAIQEFKTALAYKPDYAEPHNNLGVALKDLGQFNEAVEEYRVALRLKADYAEPHNNLGLVYKTLRHPDEAIPEFKTALALKPDYAEAHSNLAVAYKEMGKYNEAIQEFKTALSLKPDYAEVHNNLGNVYQKLGRLDEALQEYQMALTLKPDYPAPFYNQGLVYINKGKFPEALGAFKDAVRLKPDYAEAHNNLGEIYKEIGQFKEAIQEFQTAVKLNPDLAEAYYNLGDTYQHTGQTAEATQAFKQALQVKPDYEKARQALKSVYHQKPKS